MKIFEEPDCWKKSAALRRKLSSLVKAFPMEERFKLTDQILRASNSVTANIAEGFARIHYQEYIQYGRESCGSLYELIDHLIVACDKKYITEAELAELKKDIHSCLAVLNVFINYLLKAKSGNIIDDPQITYDLSEVGERITDNG